MSTSRFDRPERLYLDLGRWSIPVFSVAATLVFVVVVAMLANSARTSNGRAEDWRRRAVATEELIGGMRVVIAQRSVALNERTLQANTLAGTLDSSRGALRDTKSSVGSLTRRQRQLAAEKARTEAELQRLRTQQARTEAELQQLRTQQASLASVASELDACSQGLETVVRTPKTKPATKKSRLADCGRARANLSAYSSGAG